MRVDEGPPGTVFTSVQPVRFHRRPCYLDWLTRHQFCVWLRRQPFWSQEGIRHEQHQHHRHREHGQHLWPSGQLAGGNTVEIIGRDPAKAEELAAATRRRHRDGRAGAVPAGDIVILAVPYASAAAVVTQYGDALRGKVIVDITNPSLPMPRASSSPMAVPVAQEIAKAAPAGAQRRQGVQHPDLRCLAAGSAEGRPLDVFIAGDDAQAKAGVSAFIESLGLRPLDAGGLTMAHGAGRTPAWCMLGLVAPLRQAHRLRPRRQHSQLSAPTPSKGQSPCAFSSLAGPAIPVRTSSPS